MITLENQVEQNFYDTTLEAVTETEAVYRWQGKEMRRPIPEHKHLAEHMTTQIGRIGVLVVNDQSGEPGYFRPYMEQRLRRVIECDTSVDWCWRVEYKDGIEDMIYVKAGIIPGFEGKVIYDEAKPVTINVPTEFFNLCGEYGLSPEQVLRGFIADACGLMNYIKEPREDDYSSNGSDERSMAYDYIERAYAPLRSSF
jgi:hypothetical protein